MAGRKYSSTTCNNGRLWSVMLLMCLHVELARAQEPGEPPGHRKTARPAAMRPVQAQPLEQQAVPVQPRPTPPTATQPPPQPAAPPPSAGQKQPSAQAQANPLKPGEMLFNFQDADIQAVVKTVSQITGRNFLIDPRVKGKITIISAKPVSSRAVYEIFLSALKAQGFTAVEGPAGIVKVLPEAEGKQGAVVSGGEMPRSSDVLTTQVVVVQHGSATQMVPLLRPLMAPSALLSVYAPGNTLIITDYADNVRRLLQVIDRLDQPGSTEVVVLPLAHASALDMAQLLGRLTDNVTVSTGQPGPPGTPAGASDPNRISIVPDLRTNSLLIRTDNQGRLAQLRSLIEKLDVPAKAGGNTRVVYLRNAEATKIAELLRGLLAGEARTQRPAAQPGQAAATASASEASLVQADEASNALIISATDAVYNNLRTVIEKLDARRAQVYIEALIAEVSADDSAELGFQWAGGTPYRDGAIGAVSNFTNGTSLAGTVAAAATNPVGAIGSGLSVAYLGPTVTINGEEIVGLGGLARALETERAANVLSKPNLLTLDNAEAKIVVGRNVPFVTGSYAQTGTTSTAGNVNPFQTIERRDVGLQLKIKPQISEGNTIKLEISQEVSSIAPTAEGAADLITDKRTLDTTVVIDDGATIVLGGLIDEKTNETIQQVPILGSIPILGELFRYRTRSKSKTNLMVFLRPVIVRNAQQAQAFTEERYDYIRNIQTESKMGFSLILPTYSNPVLPELEQPPILEENRGRAGEETKGGDADGAKAPAAPAPEPSADAGPRAEPEAAPAPPAEQPQGQLGPE